MKLTISRNLGPKSSEWPETIGITSLEELRLRDPFEVYSLLKSEFPSVSLNMLYALIGAVEERDWCEIKRERKQEILIR